MIDDAEVLNIVYSILIFMSMILVLKVKTHDERIIIIEDEVLRCLSKINKRKATGRDGIGGRVLKSVKYN